MDDAEKIILFAEFELEPGKRRLKRSGSAVSINARAFDVLVFLVKNRGRVVLKEELLDQVWAGQFVEEANLAVQISQLRKCLGEKKDDPRFLVTVPGKGYEFIAETEEIPVSHLPSENSDSSARDTAENVESDHDRSPKTLFETASGTTVPKAVTPSGDKIPHRMPFSRALAGAAVLTVFLTAAFFVYFHRSDDRSNIRSIAVLPFTIQDEKQDLEYLSDGLSESVTFALSGLSELRVISRNSAFHYKGRKIEAKTIGRELNVQAVVMGRLFHNDDRLTVSVELVSTFDNTVLWGQHFNRRMSDAELLQADIAQAISKRLKMQINGSDKNRIVSRQTKSADAYKLYLLGRYHLGKLSDEGFFKAREYFQQSIDKDPEYALAYAGLADAYNRLSGWNALAQTDGFPKAKQAAIKALEIDDQLSEAHTALGTVKLFYEWDWNGAENEFRRAIEANPDNSDAHQMHSLLLTRLKRFDEAKAAMRRAHDLDPLSLEKFAGIGEILFFERRYDEAVEHYRKMLEFDPDSAFILWSLGNVYAQKSDHAAATDLYKQAIPRSGDSPDEPASLAQNYALAGKRTEALQIAGELKEKAKSKYVSPVIIAFIYAALGENDEAFIWLDKGLQQRDSILTLIEVEPGFDPLRKDPRFAGIRRSAGFE